MKRLKIRDTGLSILDVLEAVSEGLAVENILSRFPVLQPADIANSAEVARGIIFRHWALCRQPESLKNLAHQSRTGCPKTGIWTTNEENELINLLNSGATVGDAARILLRLKTDVADKFNALTNS